MKTSSRVGCLFCKADVEAADLLATVEGYNPVCDSVGARCPACAGSLELRVSGRTLAVGYTYWAGSMHFEAMAEVRVPGLERVACGPGEWAASLYGVTFPARAPGSLLQM